MRARVRRSIHCILLILSKANHAVSRRLSDGTNSGNVPVSMGVLIGDVNGNSVVNASDVSLTKSQVGQAVSGSNFREDVNANGLINSVDVALVKAKVGTALPP
jgi:uncharacterized MnhB-related membrane protein